MNRAYVGRKVQTFAFCTRITRVVQTSPSAQHRPLSPSERGRGSPRDRHKNAGVCPGAEGWPALPPLPGGNVRGRKGGRVSPAMRGKCPKDKGGAQSNYGYDVAEGRRGREPTHVGAGLKPAPTTYRLELFWSPLRRLNSGTTAATAFGPTPAAMRM